MVILCRIRLYFVNQNEPCLAFSNGFILVMRDGACSYPVFYDHWEMFVWRTGESPRPFGSFSDALLCLIPWIILFWEDGRKHPAPSVFEHPMPH